MTINELSERSARVNRRMDGVQMTRPATTREVSQLLLDEIAVVRTHVRSGAPNDGAYVNALCRVMGMCAELARVTGVNISDELDLRLPDAGEPVAK